MAQMDPLLTENQEVAGRPWPCLQNSLTEIDHDTVSMFILSLQLIQEGQLSVSVDRMCTILVNRLED